MTGPRTFAWNLNSGFSPVFVWQFAETQEEAKSLILAKFRRYLQYIDAQNLKVGEISDLVARSALCRTLPWNLIPRSENTFDVVFVGPFSGPMSVDELERQLNKYEPEEGDSVRDDRGSGYVSALDG